METKLNIGDMVFHINKELKAITEKRLKSFGIGMGQLQILMLYYEDPTRILTRSEMVHLLKIDKGNVSRNVANLLNKGYLNLVEEGNRLGMTDKGLMIKKDILIVFQEINRRMLGDLDPQQVTIVFETLRQMKENLEA